MHYQYVSSDQGSNHSYSTIKLKITVDENNTKHATPNERSWVTTDVFKAKKANLVPVTLKKTSAFSNGAKFYNLYRGNIMEDASCSITFKMGENALLEI